MKTLTLWLVLATPTPACIEQYIAENTRVVIDAVTQKAERVPTTDKPAPKEEQITWFGPTLPNLDHLAACYEIHTARFDAKAVKFVPVPKKVEAAPKKP